MKFKLSLLGSVRKALDLEIPTSNPSLAEIMSFTFGTGANKANECVLDQRELAPSATEDLDLSGTLKNAFGELVAFAKVKVLVIVNRSLLATMTIGNTAATQFLGPFGAATHTITLPPGGVFAVARPDATGWACAAGSTDLLKILNDDAVNTLTYDVGVIGEAAV